MISANTPGHPGIQSIVENSSLSRAEVDFLSQLDEIADAAQRSKLLFAFEDFYSAGFRHVLLNRSALDTYIKFSDDLKPLILKFNDNGDQSKSTIAKFLSQSDDGVISGLNNNPGLMEGIVGHKIQFDNARYQDLGEELDDLDLQNPNSKAIIEYRLDRSAGLKGLIGYAREGVELGKSIMANLKAKGDLFNKLQTKLPNLNLDDYSEILSEVPITTTGGYMKADVLLIERNVIGEIDDIIVVENKLSSGTKFTPRQKEGFSTIKAGAGLVDMIVQYDWQGLVRDQILSIDKAKCIKISDHGADDIGSILIDDFKFITEFNF